MKCSYCASEVVIGRDDCVNCGAPVERAVGSIFGVTYGYATFTPAQHAHIQMDPYGALKDESIMERAWRLVGWLAGV